MDKNKNDLEIYLHNHNTYRKSWGTWWKIIARPGHCAITLLNKKKIKHINDT